MPATFSLSPSTQTVAVNALATITIAVSGVSGGGQPFDVWDGGGGGNLPTNPPTVVGNGSTQFTYSNAAPGVYTVHVVPRIGSFYPLSGQPEQTVQVVVTAGTPPVPPDSFALAPSSNAAVVNVATALYTLTLLKSGAPSVAGVGGQAFALTSSDGGGSFNPGATVTVPEGSSSISFTYQSPNVGTATLTATASGSPYAVNVHTALAVISAASAGPGGSGGFRMGVPQSGRSSAVGLAIESVYGNAPITVVSGSNYNIGILSTNPLRFFIVEPGGGFPVKPTKVIGDAEIDGDFEVHRTTLTEKLYDGKDTFKLDPENAYYPLLGMLGRDVETTLAAGAYQHVMYHSFPGYQPSFTMEEQFGDATSGRLSSGICVAALNINHAAILTGDMTLYAKRQIPNTYPAAANVDTAYDFTNQYGLLPSQLGGDHTKMVKLTPVPSYVDVAEGNCGNGPLVFANAVNGSASGFSNTFITINDVAYPAKITPGWTIDFARGIERFMTGGSGYDADTPVASGFKASGKMEVLFTENTFPANTLANCKFGINMKFIGPQIGSTGFYYSYEIYCPRVKFLDSNVARDDKAIFTGGAFQCEKDASLGYSARVTLVNSFTHASLAGQHSSYIGGLGGWTAAA